MKKPKRAKNTKEEPKWLQETVWWSYDKDIWGSIVKDFAKRHQITEQDFTKIIAFCYPGWGSRVQKEGKYCYSVSEEDILDSRMGWGKFSKELDKSIRLMKNKVHVIDDLWESRKVVENDTYCYQPNATARYDIECWEDVVEDLAEPLEPLPFDEIPVSEKDNLFYGGWDGEED